MAPGSEPAPRDCQQARLLEILRRRAGEPVTYVELQCAGIEFPASVVAELELGGVQIDRCESTGPAGGTVGAVRLPGASEESAGRPRSGMEREAALPQAAASADWDEVRVYRGSLWLALETAWAELRRGGMGRSSWPVRVRSGCAVVQARA